MDDLAPGVHTSVGASGWRHLGGLLHHLHQGRFKTRRNGYYAGIGGEPTELIAAIGDGHACATHDPPVRRVRYAPLARCRRGEVRV